MTVAQLYRRVRERLEQAGCDSPAFDASCLLAAFGGVPSIGLPGADERAVSESAQTAVMVAANERATGRPLQYILGEWDFLALTLSVGEGVLIPRPDTELLCEVASDWLNAHHEEAPARVLDLCAGSGCVGLGVASLCRSPVQVTAVEWSDEARRFLDRNIARYPQYDVTPCKADVLRDAALFSGGYTALLSNPPYIPTADLDGLMREVQREPRMALDGGAGDGLQFYRVIAADWVQKLVCGGLCAVEVGIYQADAVAALFAGAGLQNIRIVPDLAGIPRVVAGEKGAQ